MSLLYKIDYSGINDEIEIVLFKNLPHKNCSNASVEYLRHINYADVEVLAVRVNHQVAKYISKLNRILFAIVKKKKRSIKIWNPNERTED